MMNFISSLRSGGDSFVSFLNGICIGLMVIRTART